MQWLLLLLLLGASALLRATAVVPVRTQGTGHAQAAEQGMPALRVIGSKEYGGRAGISAMVQAPNGLIYLGNEDGVLEFDGQRWRLIPTAARTAVYSLAVDPDSGRVYVGAQGEIGYLHPDAQGQARFRSLLDHVPPPQRDFDEVWQAVATARGVLFITAKRVMHLQAGSYGGWEAHGQFRRSFRLGDRLLLREQGKGLLELRGDALVPVAGGGRFADVAIVTALPWRNDKGKATILIATADQGLFQLDATGVSRWTTPVDAELRRGQISAVAHLADGRLAIGTQRGGLYLLDTQGRWLGRLDEGHGLPDNAVYSMLADREGGLWLAQSRDLVRLELSSPLSSFDARLGLEGTVYAIERHQGQLYAGTSSGLFRLQAGPLPRWSAIAGVPGAAWALLGVEQQLLVATAVGVYELDDGVAHLVFPAFQSGALAAASDGEPRVFVGGQFGLASLRREDGHWRPEAQIQGIRGNPHSLWQAQDGRLWAGSITGGAWRVRFPPGWPTRGPPHLEHFGPADGLPDQTIKGVFTLQGEPRFFTRAGILRFDEARRRFEPDPRFAKLFPDGLRDMGARAEEPGGGFWLATENKQSRKNELGFVALDEDGSYHWKPLALRALGDTRIFPITRDRDGVVWFGGEDGLFRYDPRVGKDYAPPFDVLLRRVSMRGGQLLPITGNAPLSLPYGQNQLRFEFAATRFEQPVANRYSVRLLGNDRHWSAWSTEAFKEYTNLWEGEYRLQLRAKDLHGNVAQAEQEFVFRVLPPWYRAPWAYAIYAMALIGLAWAGLRMRTRMIYAQQRRLQQQVDERTQQLLILGEVGRAITATLNFDASLDGLYAQINRMLTADVLAIGMLQPKHEQIDFRLAVHAGVRCPPYVVPLADKQQLAVWCIEHCQPLLIGDHARENGRYLAHTTPPSVIAADEQRPRALLSTLCVPIMWQDQAIGVVCLQSFSAHAYQPYHLDLLQTLASYAAIAIDNSRAHQCLIDTQQQLVTQEKMAALGTLTAGVAHEINNPTNFIVGAAQNLSVQMQQFRQFLHLLAGDDADPEVLAAIDGELRPQQEQLGTILEGSLRITRIVADLRQFTRLNEAERKRVPLSEPIRSTINLIRTRFDRIDFHVDLETEAEIECQPAKLAQVFMNLIVNACEALEGVDRPGQINIASAVAKGRAWVQVQDNGQGMDEATRRRIFDPFFTTKPVGKGTGLGLALSLGIIREHGGKIDVQSQPGVGTTMVVSLPLATATATSTAQGIETPV